MGSHCRSDRKAFAAAIAFLLFAVWTWREGRAAGPDEVVKVAEPRHVLLAVISSFVLAELGDKTMLATVALASDHHWAGVWIGATAGMVLADGVAVAVGAVLHKRLPEHFLHGMASVLFLLFGLWLLFDGGIGLRWVAVGVTAASIRRRSRRLNRRRTLAGPRLATVRRTTDQLPAVTSRSRATCRGAERRASAPPACLDN